METTTILLMLVSLVIGRVPNQKFNHPKLLDAIARCSKEYGIEIPVLLDAMKTDNVDSKGENYNLCLYQYSDCIDEDGNLKMDNFRTYLKLFYTGNAGLVENKCLKVKDTAVATALGISKCLIGLYLI